VGLLAWGVVGILVGLPIDFPVEGDTIPIISIDDVHIR
jgi:hypothetical protein